ncbi:MAG TPA: ATP-grasp domain-containing protein [Solirubrobacteraceae bacterium]
MAAVPPPSAQAQAWVLGAIDLVRALKLARVPTVVVAERENPARYSHAAVATVEPTEPSRGPEAMVEHLLASASQQRERPVLYYDNDWDLLLVSRHRDRLARGFRFVVASAELVEDLVDKARFQALAERLGFPVPRAVRCSSRELEGDPGLRYPLVVKPMSRHDGGWTRVVRAKAAHVGNGAELARLGADLDGAGIGLLIQEAVPGPEDRIESYHVYVDDEERIAGEFTGRKIRTYPREYGFSTAVSITDSAEVRELGRHIALTLELRGVAKVDFKRGADGKLKLLEVNPRFNLWHHPGALAGVNLPGLVYERLLGRPAPVPPAARAGVTWCSSHDLQAARAEGMGLVRWLRWAAACDARSGFAWDDPFPIPRAALARARDRLRWRAAG